ncbi:hypothetical protein [Desulfotalea psychrophila]|uniref:Uncharacterized protein n=1 Tax=Desulfotalea psychrophila (strain LSv54 / DSM 12343) TaxID=177439 RepID=Q6ALJ7_DESPS|nr:hypothetical protein [Desulfotalea psychrophila]CAG36778.1 hypothetical protein DP2049 [Desulfotalea psychrophila LSv54]
MSISKELFKIANNLGAYSDYKTPQIQNLIDSATAVGKSWSGSWLGYHSRVYYTAFETPPPGAVFSAEWGLENNFSGGSRGAWLEYSFDDVVSYINQQAGAPNTDKLSSDGDQATLLYEDSKSDLLVNNLLEFARRKR